MGDTEGSYPSIGSVSKSFHWFEDGTLSMSPIKVAGIQGSSPAAYQGMCGQETGIGNGARIQIQALDGMLASQ